MGDFRIELGSSGTSSGDLATLMLDANINYGNRNVVGANGANGVKNMIIAGTNTVPTLIAIHCPIGRVDLVLELPELTVVVSDIVSSACHMTDGNQVVSLFNGRVAKETRIK